MRAPLNLKSSIKEFSYSIGFHLVGFTDPQVEEKIKERYLRWIRENKHAGLWYLEDKQRIRARFNPAYLLEDVKSIIVFGVSYKDHLFGMHVKKKRAFISSYALRRDYHKVIKKKLREVKRFINNNVKDAKFRIFVDTAPVLERYFAYKAGLGFIGKNNFLINPQIGGAVFLGEIFTNIEFEPDIPLNRACGECKLCIQACPTGALSPYSIDLTRCISYHTIENKKEVIEPSLARLFGNRIFGCDECAIVCPYNKKTVTIEPFFGEGARDDLAGIPLSELIKMDENQFNKKFSTTPVKRAGYYTILRNVLIAISNSNDPSLIEEARFFCTRTQNPLLIGECKALGFS